MQDTPAQGTGCDAVPGHAGETGETLADQPTVGFLSSEKAEKDRVPKLPDAAPTQARVLIPDCYRPDAMQHIVESMLCGQGLVSICADDEMPTIGIVRQWLARDPDFRQAYIEAQKVIALTQIGEMVDIADNGESVARDRLRVNTRKVVAERLAPDVFAPPKSEGGVPVSSLSELFKTVSNQGHRLPNTVEGEAAEVVSGPDD